MQYGMNAHTGKKITGIEWLTQKIDKAIITPIDSCVLNRSFGSYTFEMISAPGNQTNLLKLYSSCVEAITRWVPEFIPTRIQAQKNSDIANGVFTIVITGITTENVDNIIAGTTINLNLPVRKAA